MRNPAGPIVYAHRGASAAAPENTLEAFRLAGRMGADGVELDVRRAADGAMVIHHDDRLADGRLIADLTAGDLPRSVPLLGAALDACGSMTVNVEIKNWPDDADFDPADRLAPAVASALSARGDPARYLVSSFRRETVDAVRELAPRIATAWLTAGVRDGDVDAVAAGLAAAGHCALHPWERHLTRRCVEACHAHGLAVNVWTVDDPDRMRELIEWGVDGIVTNVPDVALGVRGGS